MEEKKGQIGVEYLIVVGWVVFLVIGILGVAYFYTNNIKDEIKATQLGNFANKVVSSSESVFYSGEPSRVTIHAYLPAGVNVVNVADQGKSLYFEYQTSSGKNRVSFSSNVNISLGSGVITNGEGLKRIRIIAQERGVLLEQI